MMVESDTLEFEQEISRLRRVNHELEVRLEESSKVISDLTAAHAVATQTLEATIAHLRESLAEVAQQQERDKADHQRAIGEYTAKVSSLQKQLTETEKTFYLENKKFKAMHSKRKSALLIQNLTGLQTVLNSQTDSGSRNENASINAGRSRIASASSARPPKLGDWANEKPSSNTRFVDQDLPVLDRSARFDSIKLKKEEEKVADSESDISLRLVKTSSKKDGQALAVLGQKTADIPEQDESSHSGSRSRNSKSSDHRRNEDRSLDPQPRTPARVPRNTTELANPFTLHYASLRVQQSQSGGSNSPGVIAQYLDVIERLQHQVKCEEGEKKQVMEELQRSQQTMYNLSQEVMTLHKTIMQLEEEKLEILSHAEDYHTQVQATEKKLAATLIEKSRLEARIHQQTDLQSNELGDVETLKGRLAEAQASLTEMQILNNRLDSSLRERSMDYDAAVRRSKEMIADLTHRVESLKAENERLMQRCEDLAVRTIDEQQHYDMEKIEWEKSAALSQIQYASKINELEQTVKRLSETQNLGMARQGKKEKDFTDDLFSVSCLSRSVKGLGGDNKSLFSFANQDKASPQPFGTESRWQDDDVNSHQLVKEIQRQASQLLDGREGETAKENDTTGANQTLNSEAQYLPDKHHNAKRNSVVSFGQNSIESAPQSRRMSYAPAYVPMTQTDIKKKVSFHGEPSSPGLPKTGNIDDIDEREESASEPDENNDRFLRLIGQLNEMGDELAKLQADHDILKTNFQTIKNELELKQIDVKNLQSQLEMSEKTHQASRSALQAELDRITHTLVQLKTKYNEIESQKDLDQLVQNKALRAKNIEISLLRTQLDEVAGVIKRNSIGKKTS